jgi:hypothetical protein
MHKSSFMTMVPGYIPRSEGYIPLFFQGTIVLGTVVWGQTTDKNITVEKREGGKYLLVPKLE